MIASKEKQQYLKKVLHINLRINDEKVNLKVNSIEN